MKRYKEREKKRESIKFYHIYSFIERFELLQYLKMIREGRLSPAPFRLIVAATRDIFSPSFFISS